MVNRMKTTIEVPDALAKRAKQVAAEQGTTLRELVVQGLRREVERRSQAQAIDFVFPTAGGRGLRVEVDPARLTDLAYEQAP
jgi:predicted O-methyltransferase YrrM